MIGPSHTPAPRPTPPPKRPLEPFASRVAVRGLYLPDESQLARYVGEPEVPPGICRAPTTGSFCMKPLTSYLPGSNPIRFPPSCEKFPLAVRSELIAQGELTE